MTRIMQNLAVGDGVLINNPTDPKDNGTYVASEVVASSSIDMVTEMGTAIVDAAQRDSNPIVFDSMVMHAVSAGVEPTMSLDMPRRMSVSEANGLYGKVMNPPVHRQRPRPSGSCSLKVKQQRREANKRAKKSRAKNRG
jgi:hypothetical protein